MPGANAEIREARRMAVQRRLNGRRYQAAIAATDRVLEQLEMLNLEGRGKERLGSNTAYRLERVLSPVPVRLRPKIRARTVQRALDAVLDVQEPLLAGCRRAHSDLEG